MTREQYGQAFGDGGFRRTVEMVRLRGANTDQAQDFAQAAWLRGWERLGQLRDPDRVVEWVISIAVNLFLDEVTKSRRRSTLLSAVPEPKIAPQVEPANVDLYNALSRCPASHRAILQEVYLLGGTPKELAVDLGVSIGAIHHRLFRARHVFRHQMSRGSISGGSRSA